MTNRSELVTRFTPYSSEQDTFTDSTAREAVNHVYGQKQKVLSEGLRRSKHVERERKKTARKDARERQLAADPERARIVELGRTLADFSRQKRQGAIGRGQFVRSTRPIRQELRALTKT